jgi:hypothetical protein
LRLCATTRLERYIPGMPRYIVGGLDFPAEMDHEFANLTRNTLHPPNRESPGWDDNTKLDVEANVEDAIGSDAGRRTTKGQTVDRAITISESSSSGFEEEEEEMPPQTMRMDASSEEDNVGMEKRGRPVTGHNSDASEDLNDDGDDDDRGNISLPHNQRFGLSEDDALNDFTGSDEQVHPPGASVAVPYSRRDVGKFVVPDSADYLSSVDHEAPDISEMQWKENSRRSTRARQPRTLFEGLVKHVEACCAYKYLSLVAFKRI